MSDTNPFPHASAGPATVRVVQSSPGFGRLLGVAITAVSVLGGVFLLGAAATLVIMAVLGVWIGAGDLDDTVEWSTYRDGSGSTIAVLPVLGVIDGEQAAFVRRAVDRILARSRIDAVVLRVDSPGGGVAPSDRIWYQVERLRQSGLPVVASFGGIAASGGYYVACASDAIVAEETCVTGSIGVIAQVMTLEGLMDKVGIEPVTLVARRSPAKSVANDTFRSWTAADRDQVLMILDSAYDIFHRRVETGRQTAIAPDDLEALTDGSVFTAAEALARGLIDQVGYLDDAIAVAEQRAGVTAGGPSVSVVQERRTWFDALPRLERPDWLDAGRLRRLVNELGGVRFMYLMTNP